MEIVVIHIRSHFFRQGLLLVALLQDCRSESLSRYVHTYTIGHLQGSRYLFGLGIIQRPISSAR